MTEKHIVLSVIIFRDQHDPETWIAQALEHDVVAHGRGIEQAKTAFERTVAGFIRMAEKRREEPFARMGPAPDAFWSAWQRITSKQMLESRVDPNIPPAYMLQAITDEVLTVQ